MQKNWLLIDGNSVGHMANAMKPLTMGTMQVQAIYGSLRIMRGYLSKYAFATPVVLWDGLSWRKSVQTDYKANRDREETKSDLIKKEMNRNYHAQRPHIEKTLSMLGVTQVKAQNMEADDLAAIMTDLYTGQGHKVTLVSEDQDWLQLLGPLCALERPKSKDRVTMAQFEEITGVPTIRQFVEMKALMGDQGDHIKGVGGIGKGRAVPFLKEYGSFANFTNQALLEKTLDLSKLPKYLRDLAMDEDKCIKFSANMEMVDLRTSARPAVKDMLVNKGEPSLENFRRVCDLLLFKSITDIFDEWVSAFPAGKALVTA